MMMSSMAMASAVSVPLRSCRRMSARADSQFTRGSIWMMRMPRRMASTTAWPKKPSGFDSSGALPHMTRHSVSS